MAISNASLRAPVRSVVLLLALIICTGLLTSCQQSEEFGEADPRELTSEEADRLAVARFNNYDRHYSAFTMSVTSEGQQLWLDGRTDFRDHLGYAVLTANGEPPSHALLQWNLESVAAVATQDQRLPTDPPQEAPWQTRSVDPEGTALDTALNLVLQLAADRPENPLLLKQNGARWHGTSSVSTGETETAVVVISGPGSDNRPSDRLLYFLDDRGRLMKLIARVPGSSDPVVITFTGGGAEPITPLPSLS